MVNAITSRNFPLHKFLATNVTLFNASHAYNKYAVATDEYSGFVARNRESWDKIQNIMVYVSIADRRTLVSISLVFICRENPRRSGILLFPDRPRLCRLDIPDRLRDERGQIWRIGSVSIFPTHPRFLRWSAIILDK